MTIALACASVSVLMEPRGPIVTKDGLFAANAWTMVRVRRGTQAAVHERGLTVQRALEEWLGGAPQIVGQNAQPSVPGGQAWSGAHAGFGGGDGVPARHHPAAEVAIDEVERAAEVAPQSTGQNAQPRIRPVPKPGTRAAKKAEAAAYIPGDE